MPATRLYPLDLLRFLAALAVVLFHSGWHGWNERPLQVIRFEELAFFKYGILGLYLFFIISGYVISMSMEAHRLSICCFPRTAALPCLLVGCNSYFSVVTFGHQEQRLVVDTPTFFLNFTMLQSFFNAQNVDGAYWTLGFELRFYLLIFLIMLCRLTKFYPMFLALWLALCVAASQWFSSDLVNLFFFPEWAGYFIMGSCFYLLHEKKGDVRLVSATLLGSLFYILWQMPQKAQTISDFYQLPFSTEIARGFILAFFGIFVLLIKNKLSFLNRREFFTLGAISYPLYLIHQSIGYTIINMFFPEQYKYFWLFLMIEIMLVAAWATHRFVEKPIVRLLKPKILSAYK